MNLYVGPAARAPWDAAGWPHFTPGAIACPCCSEVCIRPDALDALERLRGLAGAPIVLTSAHRCALHNARVGGAPLSQHKTLAFDIALGGHDLGRLVAQARCARFTGFGFGQSFLHLDTRAHPARWFYGQRSKDKWTSVLCSIPA
jgi:zinc D-Ala-D-Ala carboxypeptidase